MEIKEMELMDENLINKKMTNTVKSKILKEIKVKYFITENDIFNEDIEDKIIVLLDNIYNIKDNINDNLAILNNFLKNKIVAQNLNKYILHMRYNKLVGYTTLGHIILYKTDDMELLKYIISLGYDYNIKDINGKSVKDEIDNTMSVLKSVNDVYYAKQILGTFEDEEAIYNYEIKQ